MSAETQDWLVENLRIGYTDQDGPAWWNPDKTKALSDGSHFPGPVPDDEVRRLLDVPLVRGRVTVSYTGTDGQEHEVTNSEDFMATVFADNGRMIKPFKSGYQIHGYNEWINDSLAAATDGKLPTKSAGLLRKRAVAFHQVRLPDAYEVHGYGYVPFFTAGTSADGSLASTWFTGADAAICDNTFEMARQGASTRLKWKHSAGSVGKMVAVRDRLGLTLKAGDEFAQMIDQLVAQEVTDRDFELWLDEMAPLTDEAGDVKKGRALTMAHTKRDELTRLYRKDPKVAPWTGTAFGILQADNTYRTWSRTVQSADGGRMERNLVNQVIGISANEDQAALEALARVQSKRTVMLAS